ISAPEKKNAPTAASKPIPPAEEAISAAPGVDHAAMMGMRWRRLRYPLVAATARHRAATQDDVCATSAPTACAAATMSATVPPKPTSAATMADITTDIHRHFFIEAPGGRSKLPAVQSRGQLHIAPYPLDIDDAAAGPQEGGEGLGREGAIGVMR